jgi:ABC-type dipeptide/oligopeptide/nickel transport system permease subunit
VLASVLRHRLGAAALAVLGVMVLLAVFGPLLAPYDPLAQNASALLQGPSAAHWLGTDDLGRDTSRWGWCSAWCRGCCRSTSAGRSSGSRCG